MNFEGRKIILKNGYPIVYWPNHNLAYKDGTAYIHRIVAERVFGSIPKDFHVHHKDGNRCNWDHNNLVVLSPEEHVRCHTEHSIVLSCDYCSKKIIRKPSGVNKNNYCNNTCRGKDQEVIDWPPVNVLLSMIEDSSYVAVGRQLGVTDNAVRKRIKNHSLGYIPSSL